VGSLLGSLLAHLHLSALVAHLVSGFGLDLLVSADRWLLGEIVDLLTRLAPLGPALAHARGLYRDQVLLAAALMLPVLAAAAIAGVMRASLSALGEALARVPLAVLMIVVTPFGVLEADRVVRAVSSGLLQGLTSLVALGTLLRAVGNLPGSSIAVTLILSGVVLVGALALFLELVMRNAAIVLLVTLVPLASLGLVLPFGRQWPSRVLRSLFGLVVAKLVIALGVGLGAAELRGASASRPLATVLVGLALVLVAAFAPVAVLRLAAVAELVALEAAVEARSLVTGRLAAVGNYAIGTAWSWSAEAAATRAARLPVWKGHPPPEEIVKRAEEDPWVWEILYGRQQKGRRHG
jgi:hypothetical protein